MAIEQGKLVRWIDEKGFGFIKPENGGNDVFIHISSLKSSRKPIIGDTIFYEINIDANGKPKAINAIIEGVSQSLTLTPISTQTKPTPPPRQANRGKSYGSKANKRKQTLNLLPIVIIIGIAALMYYKASKDSVSLVSNNVPELDNLPLKQASQFQCQGKIHCSEMSSYDEAVFYLQNCPGTKMDGDGDGEPCERQF